MSQQTVLKKNWLETCERVSGLAGLEREFFAACGLLVEGLKSGGQLLVCGNGGSAADAIHFVSELRKSYFLPRQIEESQKSVLRSVHPEYGSYLAERLQRGMRAVNLVGDAALMTAVANDNGADLVFAQQVIDYAKPDDVFVGFSTSGNSRNVVLGALTAKAIGAKTLAFTGPAVSELSKICDVTLRAPGENSQRVQEAHLHLHHAFSEAIEMALFGPHEEN